MQEGDTRQIAVILKQFKLPTGKINYPVVFTVPSVERLPVLYQNDFMKATALVVGALTVAFEKMTFKKKMTGELINDIAEAILDSCSEDNLSLEDLMLFLQRLVRGEFGNVEELSIARFMNLFEIYRQERHEAILAIREEKANTGFALGDNSRTVKSDPLTEHFATFGERISALKDQIQYERNPNLKDIDKF